MNTKDISPYPEAQGKIDIYPEIDEGSTIGIRIIGDPEGLRYLARVLNHLADHDQEKDDCPAGTRAHGHLHPAEQLGTHSCDVEVCRADARGGGELPEFMRERN